MLGLDWNRAGIGWKGTRGSFGGDENILNYDNSGDIQYIQLPWWHSGK